MYLERFCRCWRSSITAATSFVRLGVPECSPWHLSCAQNQQSRHENSALRRAGYCTWRGGALAPVFFEYGIGCVAHEARQGEWAQLPRSISVDSLFVLGTQPPGLRIRGPGGSGDANRVIGAPPQEQLHRHRRCDYWRVGDCDGTFRTISHGQQQLHAHPHRQQRRRSYCGS